MKRNEPHLSLSPSLITRVKKCYVITCNWKWWDFSSDRMRQPYAHYAGLVSTAEQSVMKIQKFLLFCHRFHPQLLCLYRHSQRSLTMARHKANNTSTTNIFIFHKWMKIYLYRVFPRSNEFPFFSKKLFDRQNNKIFPFDLGKVWRFILSFLIDKYGKFIMQNVDFSQYFNSFFVLISFFLKVKVYIGWGIFSETHCILRNAHAVLNVIMVG